MSEKKQQQKNQNSLMKQPISLQVDAITKKINLDKFLWKKSAACLLLPLIGVSIAFLSSCSQQEVSRNVVPQEETAQEVQRTEAISNRPLEPTPEDKNFVVAVVEQVEPAVVQINTARTVQNQVPEAFNDPFFRRYFGDRLPTQPEERVVRGIGSGFVIDSEGLILTNAHVVNNADEVTVTFPDGRSFQGKVLGEDTLTDVAVVKIPANNLQPIELGNSQQVQSGQWAIAIGNPLGLEKTVTVGVVSAIDRSIGAADGRVGFIQTDAAINPGNSGGPLLNARGQVIGVNTAIIGNAQGIGFAIPIDTAQRIAQQIINTGKVEHPYIGVQILPLTPEVRQKINNSPNLNINVQADQGILVVDVASGSPADRAGIREGDVITQVNNQRVTTSDQLLRLIERNGIGNNLQLGLQRDGKTLQLTVRTAALPATARQR
jgi:serine protease Do